MLPISVIEHDGIWVAASNDETKTVLGDLLHGVAQGDSKADAIDKMFYLIRASHRYSEECRLKYQRWVPFRSGNWKYSGGKWFSVFGIHIYFRYGKGMKGGWYIPFTKLNVIIRNDWAMYKEWKRNRKIAPPIQ